MPQLNPGDSQNLNLEAGKVLTVSCTSTASAIVRAFPMAAGTEQTSQTSVAANGSQAFGPFLVPTRWEIDTFGPGASYTVGDSPSAVAGETLMRVDSQTGAFLGSGRTAVVAATSALTEFPAERVSLTATGSVCASPCQIERIRCVTGTSVALTVYDNAAASAGTQLYSGTLSAGQEAAITTPIRAINGIRAVFASGAFDFYISQEA